MTALMRIVGCLWLFLVAMGVVLAYSLTRIWQGVTAATADAPIGMTTVLAIAVPGLVLIGLATWLDRRRPRAIPDRRFRR